jgi:hypothetical protein
MLELKKLLTVAKLFCWPMLVGIVNRLVYEAESRSLLLVYHHSRQIQLTARREWYRLLSDRYRSKAR